MLRNSFPTKMNVYLRTEMASTHQGTVTLHHPSSGHLHRDLQHLVQKYVSAPNASNHDSLPMLPHTNTGSSSSLPLFLTQQHLSTTTPSLSSSPNTRHRPSFPASLLICSSPSSTWAPLSPRGPHHLHTNLGPHPQGRQRRVHQGASRSPQQGRKDPIVINTLGLALHVPQSHLYKHLGPNSVRRLLSGQASEGEASEVKEGGVQTALGRGCQGDQVWEEGSSHPRSELGWEEHQESFLPAAGLAQHNRAALNEMQAKHPAPAQPSTFQQESDTPQMHFSQAQVVKAIQSFPKGSDPGPSGLRAEHLKATIKCHAPNRTG